VSFGQQKPFCAVVFMQGAAVLLCLNYIPSYTWGNKESRISSPYGSRRSRLPEFLDSQHMRVVKLSVLCTSCL